MPISPKIGHKGMKKRECQRFKEEQKKEKIFNHNKGKKSTPSEISKAFSESQLRKSKSKSPNRTNRSRKSRSRSKE